MAAVFTTLPQVTVATAGTEQRLSANPISNVIKIYVSAPSTNTGNIWVGDSSVAVGRGVEVVKGTTLPITAEPGMLLDINNIYVDVATSGDKASVAYLSKV